MIDEEEISADVLAELTPQLDAAAKHLAGAIRDALPSDTGKTKGNVRVLTTGPLERTVNVPWPWQYNEFGTINQKANPVVRRTLLREQNRILEIIAG